MTNNEFLKLCRSGSVSEIAKAISDGVDVNTRRNGVTALMLSAWFGNTGAAETLLAHGADVNARDNNDRTALMRASWNGRTEITELLINHGADINAMDKDGKTALMFARRTEIENILTFHRR